MDVVIEAASMAAEYVHSCQVEDGGYFFARIAPGSLRDTCFAVETLHLLGQQPERLDALKHFAWLSLHEQPPSDAHALYLHSKLLSLLGEDRGQLRPMVQGLWAGSGLRDRAANLEGLYFEVTSELEDAAEQVSLFLDFALSFGQAGTVDLVRSLRNPDGGFGRQGISTLATTCDAVRILNMLGYHPEEGERVLGFLESRERDLYFLDDLYYLETARSILGGARSDTSRSAPHVLGCQRLGVGFARARPIGIPTLEYTYCAISIMKLVDALTAVQEQH